MTRFGRTGQQADLDRAITTGQEAVDATPADHPGRPSRLSNLGAALRSRFERTGQQADVDQAITVLREAVDATPAGHPDRPWHLSNLGRRAADAVRAHRAAGGPGPGHHRRPGGGRRHPGRPPRQDQAPLQLRERAAGPVRAHRAAGGPGSGPRGVSRGCRGGDCVTSAACGGSPGLGPVRVAGGGSGGRGGGVHGGDRVAGVGGLAWAGPGDSGASPAGMGRAGLRRGSRGGRRRLDPARAVELLEAGRSMLWTQALHLRQDLAALQERAPDLAAVLEASRAVLNAPSTSLVGGPDAARWRRSGAGC